MTRVILASGSPRRRAILAATGLPFDVVPSRYEEDNTLNLPPAELVKHLALGKARDVSQRHPDAVVIGADTLVIVDGLVLGKPADAAEVEAMISRLSGRWHSVFTGLALSQGQRTTVEAVETRVHLCELSPAQIRRYAQLSEPLDKAGAYGIQAGSAGSLFIDRIEGDYLGVVGLPLNLLGAQLIGFGIDLLDGQGKPAQ